MTRSKIRTSGADGLTLSSTSLTIANGLTLTDGDVTLASGHGISFSATSDGSGTDTSELFDDYEEGTFTPTLVSGSTVETPAYSIQSGFYTKVGRVVNFEIDFRLNGMTAASGHFSIDGLPYTSNGTSSLFGFAVINYQGAFLNDDADVSIHIGTNSTQVQFYTYAGATMGGNNSYVYNINARLILSGRYFSA